MTCILCTYSVLIVCVTLYASPSPPPSQPWSDRRSTWGDPGQPGHQYLHTGCEVLVIQCCKKCYMLLMCLVDYPSSGLCWHLCFTLLSPSPALPPLSFPLSLSSPSHLPPLSLPSSSPLPSHPLTPPPVPPLAALQILVDSAQWQQALSEIQARNQELRILQTTMQVCTWSHTHARTHTHTHAHTQTRTCTHTHTACLLQMCTCLDSLYLCWGRTCPKCRDLGCVLWNAYDAFCFPIFRNFTKCSSPWQPLWKSRYIHVYTHAGTLAWNDFCSVKS